MTDAQHGRTEMVLNQVSSRLLLPPQEHTGTSKRHLAPYRVVAGSCHGRRSGGQFKNAAFYP